MSGLTICIPHRCVTFRAMCSACEQEAWADIYKEEVAAAEKLIADLREDHDQVYSAFEDARRRADRTGRA